jgi:hypothetical protein
VQFERKPDEPCRRGAAREAVMLAGSAMAITRSRSVVISDLSSHGARLGGRDLPHNGDEVLMVVGSVDAMATVVWQSADKCGVRFDEPLGEPSIVQMKRDAAWAEVTGWTI